MASISLMLKAGDRAEAKMEALRAQAEALVGEYVPKGPATRVGTVLRAPMVGDLSILMMFPDNFDGEDDLVRRVRELVNKTEFSGVEISGPK